MARKALILLGPTGVGKTGVSLLLAKALNTEIISADSMQIYRYMDIGTAKPSSEERLMIKHHMIDIVDPWETYSAGKYINEVVPIIDEIHREGKLPIIAGGTGLYVKAMTRGIFSGPSADWSLRGQLLSLEDEEKGILYNFLKDLDPETTSRITSNDKRRIIRALEVCLKSDSSMSEMQRIMTKPLPYEFIKIGLLRDRKELYRLIEQRVDEMIKAGLVEEVRIVIDLIKARAERGYGDTENKKFTDLPFPSTCRHSAGSRSATWSPLETIPALATTTEAGPERFAHPSGAIPHRLPVGDVGDDSLRLAARPMDLLHQLAERLRLHVPAPDPIAHGCEPPRVCCAHAAGGAGDPDGAGLAHRLTRARASRSGSAPRSPRRDRWCRRPSLPARRRRP